MAWNWIVNLAQYCNLYVITEGEYKDLIEDAVQKLPQRDNIHFYYNPVPEKVRQMCWNQGDWRFYYYYRKWQKSTYRLALKIIDEHKIDVVHQLNMIGFREPGYLWKIEAIPFVWGPIGGMELMPVNYLQGASLKMKVVTYLKNLFNICQYKYSRRVGKAIRRADALVAAVKGVQDKIICYYGCEVALINETGCYPKQSIHGMKPEKDSFDVLWVGKFDFRKQLGLALQTIAQIKHLNGLQFHIAGTGSDREVGYYKAMADRLGISNICRWHGVVPNADVQAMMRESDLLLFTSIMEGTSHAVLEAISNDLPVLCFDAYGQSVAVNNSVGIKIPISSTKQSIQDFSREIFRLYSDRGLLQSMSQACKQRQDELSWDSKARKMVAIYEQLLS
jgi:glycosyltransferase involved in cell wall biosynthesis